MKQLFTSTFALLLSLAALAQVPKTVVVEHFTNSRCSVCASRNPGFYTNLNLQQNTIHLAIHPSSPYPTCIFNQANVLQNDGRTNYYGIFGSTPRLVIQGETITASVNYSNQTVFDPYLNQTSPASLNISQTNNGSEIQIRIAVKTEAENTLENLKLFAALKENQVDYDAPNGEDIHYDVFRESFFNIYGTLVNLGPVGDSVIVIGAISIDPSWNQEQLSAIVILQEDISKSVVQASEQNTPGAILSINSPKNSISIYPNPARDYVTIKSPNNNFGKYQIYNALGKIVTENSFNGNEKIDLSEIPAGIYFIKMQNANSNFVERLLIQ